MARSFNPKASIRAVDADGRNLYFYEITLAPGPLSLAGTGDNTFPTLFGRDWLLELRADDNTLHLYGEEADGSWTEQETLLPPVFDAPLPADARRISFAFDQSARLIVAYETAGHITATRWDIPTAQYVQNVDFLGANPAVLMEASYTYYVPGSDVYIFYQQDGDPTTICYRIQSENYQTEHVFFTDPQIGVLDKALSLVYKYELLVSDAYGQPLAAGSVLEAYVSDLADVHIRDVVPVSTAGPGGGLLFLKFVEYQGAAIEVAALSTLSGPGGGDNHSIYLDVTLNTIDAFSDALAGPGGGLWFTIVIEHTLNTVDAFSGALAGPSSGLWFLKIEEVTLNTMDTFAGGLTGPGGGSYV